MQRENTEHNGHRRVSRRATHEHDWQSTAREALGALSKMDVPNVIRKNPYPALAIAGATGLLIGITVGSRMVRMLIGSIGMYAASELGRRYAGQILQNMESGAFQDEEEPIEVD